MIFQVATNLVKYADTKSGEERLRERQAVVEGLAQDVVNEAEPGPGTAYSLQASTAV